MMSRVNDRMNRNLLIAAAFLLAVPAVLAQDAPPPPPAAPGGPMQAHGKQARGAGAEGRGGDMRGGGRGEGRGDDPRGGEMRGGMGRLLPPGTWWRNPEVVTRVGLTTDQVKRIDDVFVQSRTKLIDLHASLEKEQLLLQPLLNANPVDQGKAMGEISKIADTRAELEKTDARMLLGIRGVLNADQWTKLQARHGGRERDGKRGPDGQRGPGGRGQGDRPVPPAGGPGAE